MKGNFFASFNSFYRDSGKYLFFTILFYSLWLLHSLISNQNFDLESFPQRMIGTATLEAYDVSRRVSLFYKSILLLLSSICLFYSLGYFLHTKSLTLLKSTEVKLLNYASLIGIVFLLFRLFDYEVTYSLELVYYVHKLMLLALFLRSILLKKSVPSLPIYSLIVLLSFSFYFFIADCFNLAGAIKNPDFLICTFISSLVLMLGVLFLSKKMTTDMEQKLITKLAYVLVPLNFLPLISVAKDEIFFILKNNNLVLPNANLIFIILFLLLLVSIFLRSKSFNKQINLSLSHLIAYRYFPVLIFSFITYVYYSHYFFYNDESFESGNKYLPIMEFQLYGTIPTLEKFNSHLLSDYFFNAIYTFLNGMGDLNEMELYDFMYIPFSFTLFYSLILLITRNPYISAFTILLFPFYASMLPGGYSFCIPGIFALYLLLAKGQNLKNYLILFFTIVGIVLWRFDLGYTCMVIIPVILFSYHFVDPHFKIQWAPLLKALFIVLGLLAVLFLSLSVYRNVNLFSKSLYTLNYFTSAQTYGYTTIGWDSMPSYKMHYFVFPILIALIILALIANFRRLNVSKNQRLAYLSLFFICCYYIVNFNRGLVRHSLIEWTDEFTATFLYIILPGCIFVFYHNLSTLSKFILFTIISFFSILTYKLPLTQGSISLAEVGIKKIQTLNNDTLASINNRIKGLPPYRDNKDIELIDFMQANTKPTETFIDFTGSSLLYFYTKKITPSFFFQNPLCSHNEFLQKHFIEDLNDYQTPYLLFSSVNENDYDVVDAVPNTLRNYRMAEYFYQNYEPHLVLGHLRVWKKRGVVDRSHSDTLFKYIKTNVASNETIKTSISLKKDKKYLLRLEMNTETNGIIKLAHEKDTISPKVYKASRSLSYVVINSNWPSADVIIKNTLDSCNRAVLLECDHLPDFYSDKFLSYNFRKLPYIWGSFDKELFSEKILFEKALNYSLQNGALYQLDIPENIDKSSGNTIILTCKNTGKKTETLIFRFGNKAQNDKSQIAFDILPSSKEQTYAIRISSVYKWYSAVTNEIIVSSEAAKSIELKRLQITKGN